ncbi:MAG: methyltransferase domain-containing protein, partial [Acidobacteriota bacterium]
MPRNSTLTPFAIAAALMLPFGSTPGFGQDGDPHGRSEKHAHGGHGGHGGHGDHGDLHAPGHRRDFSDVERWSAIFDAPERDEWQRPGHVVELMAIEAGMTVADLGAGTGYFLPHLAAAVGAEGRVYALDVEESLVDHMRDRAEAARLVQVKAQLAPRDGRGLA